MRPFILALSLSLSLAVTVPALAQDPHAGHGAPAAVSDPAAHGVVTSPAEGEMLAGSPDWFTATFSHPMTLTAVTIAVEGQAPRTVPVVAAAATTEVAAELPPLAPGRYVLNWTAQGADGHQMASAVQFMVH